LLRRVRKREREIDETWLTLWGRKRSSRCSSREEARKSQGQESAAKAKATKKPSTQTNSKKKKNGLWKKKHKPVAKKAGPTRPGAGTFEEAESGEGLDLHPLRQWDARAGRPPASAYLPLVQEAVDAPPSMFVLLALLLRTAVAESRPRRECFGFFSGTVWRQFNWTTATTVVPTTLDLSTDFGRGGAYAKLAATAHANGARVAIFANAVRSGRAPLPLNGSAAEQAAWVAEAVRAVREYGVDGVNFDFEGPLVRGDARNAGYVRLVNATRLALLAAWEQPEQPEQRSRSPLPRPQVSVDVGWSANHVDGRYYDGLGLAAVSDFLYVMGYDLRSRYAKVRGVCRAGANAALPDVERGLQSWLKLGVPARKLILGVPWYGFRYPCLQTAAAATGGACAIKAVPFRGSQCSDAAGGEVPFVGIRPLLANASATAAWDAASSTPYLQLQQQQTSSDSQPAAAAAAQLWYDDPRSLLLKMALVKKLGLGGGGPYEFSDLDYADTVSTRAFWDTLSALNDPA